MQLLVLKKNVTVGISWTNFLYNKNVFAILIIMLTFQIIQLFNIMCWGGNIFYLQWKMFTQNNIFNYMWNKHFGND